MQMKLAVAALLLVMASDALAQSGVRRLNRRPFGERIIDVGIVDTNSVYVVGQRGLFGMSRDRGATWAISRIDGFEDIIDAAFIDKLTGFAGGFPGIYRTSDGGATWSIVDAAAQVEKIEASSSGTIIAL